MMTVGPRRRGDGGGIPTPPCQARLRRRLELTALISTMTITISTINSMPPPSSLLFELLTGGV